MSTHYTPVYGRSSTIDHFPISDLSINQSKQVLLWKINVKKSLSDFDETRFLGVTFYSKNDYDKENCRKLPLMWHKGVFYQKNKVWDKSVKIGFLVQFFVLQPLVVVKTIKFQPLSFYRLFSTPKFKYVIKFRNQLYLVQIFILITVVSSEIENLQPLSFYRVFFNPYNQIRDKDLESINLGQFYYLW